MWPHTLKIKSKPFVKSFDSKQSQKSPSELDLLLSIVDASKLPYGLNKLHAGFKVQTGKCEYFLPEKVRIPIPLRGR
jgi:hypothetical protein